MNPVKNQTAKSPEIEFTLKQHLESDLEFLETISLEQIYKELNRQTEYKFPIASFELQADLITNNREEKHKIKKTIQDIKREANKVGEDLINSYSNKQDLNRILTLETGISAKAHQIVEMFRSENSEIRKLYLETATNTIRKKIQFAVARAWEEI